MTINYHDIAICLLANGFSDDFAEFCAGDERMHDIICELAEEFVETNIPVVRDDDAMDVALELLMRVTVTKV